MARSCLWDLFQQVNSLSSCESAAKLGDLSILQEIGKKRGLQDCLVVVDS
jgi:hypothetical protein